MTFLGSKPQIQSRDQSFTPINSLTSSVPLSLSCLVARESSEEECWEQNVGLWGGGREEKGYS